MRPNGIKTEHFPGLFKKELEVEIKRKIEKKRNMSRGVIISPYGVLTNYNATNFTQCWSKAKEVLRNATLEKTTVSWNGNRCLALIDEDGLQKGLETNLIATAAYQLYLDTLSHTVMKGKIVGTIIILPAGVK